MNTAVLFLTLLVVISILRILGSNHSDTHMLLIPIGKLSNERDSFRKAREAHIIHKAKTLEPLGINKRDKLESVTKQIFICFSFLSNHTILRHIICNLCCPNKPDEDWYWPVEISYTQAFSRCLISPCSSLFFDFHLYFY